MAPRRGESVVLHRLGPRWARISAAWGPLRHHPVARRAARHRVGAAALAVVTGLTVFHLASDGRRLRDGWGRTEQVVVTTRPIAAGEVLDGAVRLEPRPAAVVADGAVHRLPPPGRRATRDLPARRELVAADGAPAGRGPLAAALAPGTAGVTVRLDGSAPPVAPGDRVDVVATAAGPGATDPDPAAASDGAADPTGAPASSWPRLARRATVLEVGDGEVTLAVDEAAAVVTAAVAATGGVTLVVRR
ncbi:MAG: hypothetical protein ACOYOP_13795 [Microthrixaceae bacterium]